MLTLSYANLRKIFLFEEAAVCSFILSATLAPTHSESVLLFNIVKGVTPLRLGTSKLAFPCGGDMNYEHIKIIINLIYK